MRFWRFIGSRLVQLAVTMFIIITLVFILFNCTPGDPIKSQMRPNMTAEEKAQLRISYGLDKPLYARYFIYLKNLARGDFGKSYYKNEPVISIVAKRLPATLLLFTTAVILAYTIGVPLGKLIAWWRGGVLETSLTIFGIFFYTIFLPWFALIVIWLLAYFPSYYWDLDIFPLAGMITPEVWADPATGWFRKVLDILHHLILPLCTLVLVFFARSMLLMRSSMLETLEEDYITTARAKGLPDKVIRNKHAARNAWLPVVTAMTMALAFSINGSVLAEKVFNWPGLGNELIDAVLNNDHFLAIGTFIFLAFLVLTANLIADILYAVIDPRVKY